MVSGRCVALILACQWNRRAGRGLRRPLRPGGRRTRFAVVATVSCATDALLLPDRAGVLLQKVARYRVRPTSCAPALRPSLQGASLRQTGAHAKDTSRMASRRWPPAGPRCDWSIPSIPRCDRSSRAVSRTRLEPFRRSVPGGAPLLSWVGWAAIDQFVDSTDVLINQAAVGTIAASEIWPTKPD